MGVFNMKQFCKSKLELYLLKSEAERVKKGIAFMYEFDRYNITSEILANVHHKYAIRRVTKTVYYRPVK